MVKYSFFLFLLFFFSCTDTKEVIVTSYSDSDAFSNNVINIAFNLDSSKFDFRTFEGVWEKELFVRLIIYPHDCNYKVIVDIDCPINEKGCQSNVGFYEDTLSILGLKVDSPLCEYKVFMDKVEKQILIRHLENDHFWDLRYESSLPHSYFHANLAICQGIIREGNNENYKYNICYLIPPENLLVDTYEFILKSVFKYHNPAPVPYFSKFYSEYCYEK